jgi:DNA-nicking Smr family endonuclease
MHREDDDPLREAYRGVKPLDAEPREPNPPRRPDDAAARRAAASAAPEPPAWTGGSLAALPDIGPDTPLAFHRPGLQLRQWEKLRRGQLPWERGVDLHGCTLAEGIGAVQRLINEALASDESCVHVVHGKGQANGERATLKAELDRWLREQPDVLAFCSAQPRDGGTGAVYLLLRRRRDR